MNTSAITGGGIRAEVHLTRRNAVARAEVHSLTRQLPGLTGGEGLLETAFGHHRPSRQG
jgi:hypothetical protein